jgi:16S rRNA (guanine966-N2)-methyltransferase
MRIIAGEWGGRRSRAPAGRDVRPTTDRVREAWMSALGWRIEDARVLDLFSGSGALGLETLSRGAAEVLFVERARGALAALEANIELLGAGGRCRIVRDDVFSHLRKLPAPDDPGFFDLALADPPYGRGWAAELVRIFGERPFARELWVEHRSSEVIPEAPGARQRRYGDTTLTIIGGELPARTDE